MECMLTSPGHQRLEHPDAVVVRGPGVHLAVRVAPLLRQLVPRLRLRQQLGHRALRQPQHELGKQPLPDVVHAQQFPYATGDVQGVQRLVGVPGDVEYRYSITLYLFNSLLCLLIDDMSVVKVR